MILANGQRAGFFVGDGAGVGKGRQVGEWNKSEMSSLVGSVTALGGLKEDFFTKQ